MRIAWLGIWQLIAALVGAANPVAAGLTDLSETFACGARIARKSAENFESSLDVDAVAAAARLRDAKTAAGIN